MSVLELVGTSTQSLSMQSTIPTDEAIGDVKPPAELLAHPDELVDSIIAHVGKNIVLGLPLAIGKPIAFVNALYQRAKSDPSISLNIETGISLEKPVGKNSLEKQFLKPFVDREFANVPDLDYILDLRKGAVPDNIAINEFFFKAGSFLNSPQQQNYTSTNYTHAVRDLLDKGVNVVAQLVAKRTINGVTTYSLCSNSDLALDFAPVMDELQKNGTNVAMVAEVNSNMPFMQNHAEVADNVFDLVLDQNLQQDHKDYALFAAPHASISPEDHMIGFYASTLVKDGGTLQVGIGSLSSALTYSTLLRHKQNSLYTQLMKDLQVEQKFPICKTVGDTGTFVEGLYGCSELMVDGFMHLYNAGVLKREVFEDLTIQTLLNKKKITTQVTISTLLILQDHNAISTVLTDNDVTYLKRIGVFKPSVELIDGLLHIGEQSFAGNLKNAEALQWITKYCLGDALTGGVVMHGAFFIGPKDFYDALNNMSDADHKKFCMTSVNYVNDLYDHFIGNQQLKQAQRKHARFINSAMMVTLNGSAISDALENGQVVSGVGGQYNFVAQSHQMPDSRSIMKLRSCAVRNGKLKSNILFNYGHTTIPRQLRDIVITEYGIADLRSKPDHVVYTELIKISDSRFQQELLNKAKAAGKVAKNYEIPAEFCNNTPQAIAKIYQTYTQKEVFGPFPFGCSFTEQELKLGKALKSLKSKSASRKGKMQCLWQVVTAPKPSQTVIPLLKRMGLDNPKNLQEHITKRLLTAELSK
ncbi:acetyl-CoA hydrolase/transferase C-terminal domain-containing protein [Photobacterium sp.]|uniref:acetyl-CoA hydrolase/transferase C-terminal domain-containing protein n=1 Tax=Photobacterium sp. TaxID=660 RepID=UPI00299F0A96|nr:acetyl-CoA hydrolase/transferase C-terminal domain-containing protein [Photobacterium sp.]MDX1301593.1 acetyl-CoA hydrolase/transferase C-terminal domain-containing protein [Photobacterium sp.]